MTRKKSRKSTSLKKLTRTPTKKKKQLALIEGFLGEEVIVIHPGVQTYNDDSNGGVALAPHFSEGILMEIEYPFVGLGNGMEVENIIHISQITNLSAKKEENILPAWVNMAPQGGQC